MIPRNYKIFKRLDSTNEEAKRLSSINSGEMWILALEQTRGRGRNGKIWLSYRGNFTASLLHYPDKDTSYIDLSLKSFVAGIALFDSIVELGVSKERLRLKWPNDLLLDQRKIAGILLETFTSSKTSKKSLIVGFGLNLKSCPNANSLKKGSFMPGKLKSSVQNPPSPESFLKILMPLYCYWDKVFKENGFAIIQQEFLNRTFPFGEQISVKTGIGSITGSFCGIRNDGALILNCVDGINYVTAGDVTLIGEM